MLQTVIFLTGNLTPPLTLSTGYTAPSLPAPANGSSSPLTRTGSPSDPPQVNQQGNGQSPMAALMSVADNLPPGSPRSAGGSPPGANAPRSASRGSQHSPNSSGDYCEIRKKGVTYRLITRLQTSSTVGLG